MLLRQLLLNPAIPCQPGFVGNQGNRVLVHTPFTFPLDK